jgi:hypothetical protein
MGLQIILLACALTGLLAADTLTLKDGRKIEGIYMGGDSRQVRMAVGDQVQSFSVSDAAGIQFGSPATATAAKQEAAPAATTASTTAPAQTGITVPAKTNVVVRMIDAIDSERDRVGQTYRASLDEPLMIDAQQVAGRGADVLVKLVDDQKAGKISGKSQVTINLVSISINGRAVDVTSDSVVQASASRTKQSAGVIGGTSALGAVIGAIAGGGRGAAIGAASGAGAGTAVQVLTNGPTVKIPSETRLTFSLAQPVKI